MSRKWFAAGVLCALAVIVGAVWAPAESVVVLCRLAAVVGLSLFGAIAAFTNAGCRRWERVGWSHAQQAPWSVERPRWRRLGAFAAGAFAVLFAFFVVVAALN